MRGAHPPDRAEGARIEARLLRLDASPSLLDGFRTAGHPDPPLGIAEALVRSPPASRMPGVAAAFRANPEPLLVLAGPMDTAARRRMTALEGLLHEAESRIRLLSWRDVEDACASLAVAVREHLPAGSPHPHVRAVPRGGLIVTGLLTYALGIPASRIGWDSGAPPGESVLPGAGTETTDHDGPHQSDPTAPILVVDDVALSGVRLREVLGALPAHRRIVIATLASHPELRAAVVEAEPQVDAFVSGLDLKDHGPRLLGEADGAWRETWLERNPDRYHTALLDMIVFPWSEPPLRLWNEEEGKLEEGWRVAPPELCFRTRHTPPAIPLQHVDDLPGMERLLPHVVPLDLDDRTLLLGVDTGDQDGSPPSVALRWTAREIWRLWMPGGRDAAVAGMRERYPEVEPNRIQRDVDALLAQLSDAGIIRLDH